jgi:hypothetical protein
MRMLLLTAATGLLTEIGCATRRLHPTPTTDTTSQKTEWNIVPSPLPSPKIVQVNPSFQFVVLEFGRHPLLPTGTQLTVYRLDLPVGVVRLSEPARGSLVTADIVEGNPRSGDEVR